MKKAISLGLLAGAVAGLALWAGQSSPKVSLKDTELFSYVCLSHTGPYSDIPEVVNQLMQDLQMQNAAPMGPLMAIFFSDPDTDPAASLSWEVGFPVSEEIMVEPPLEKKQWTFARVAACIHSGSYETTSETIRFMRQWIKDSGYAAAGPVLERYTDMDPDTGNLESLKTEIWIPIQDAEK
jgi:effector-binding domain-containing protein